MATYASSSSSPSTVRGYCLFFPSSRKRCFSSGPGSGSLGGGGSAGAGEGGILSVLLLCFLTLSGFTGGVAGFFEGDAGLFLVGLSGIGLLPEEFGRLFGTLSFADVPLLGADFASCKGRRVVDVLGALPGAFLGAGRAPTFDAGASLFLDLEADPPPKKGGGGSWLAFASQRFRALFKMSSKEGSPSPFSPSCFPSALASSLPCSSITSLFSLAVGPLLL